MQPVVVSVHQWDPGSILWRAFVFFPSSFFSLPRSHRLAFLFFSSFFSPLISFFLFSFYYYFPIPFLSILLLVSPFLLLFFLFFLPLFYFPDFFLLFLSSLFLILFVFSFSFSPLNFFLVSPLYQGGCYEHNPYRNDHLVTRL